MIIKGKEKNTYNKFPYEKRISIRKTTQIYVCKKIKKI
jgi:hypothetical protein